MKITTQIQIGKLTALVSFFTGTALFFLYYFTEFDNLLFIGYYFVIIAGILNLSVLLLIVSKSATDTDLQKGLNQAKKLILLNIPIATLYIFGIVVLLSYMRISLINKTGSEITNIQIIGCDAEEITKLLPNERRTKWIHINGDCSIGLHYIENGIIKREVIASYVSGLMGQKIRYEIGGDSDWEF